jgi:carbon monoxide dehydrogenase subunit G
VVEVQSIVPTSELVTQDVPQVKDSFDIYFGIGASRGCLAGPVEHSRIVPYIPQVRLTEVLDKGTNRGLIAIGLGPINSTCSTVVTVEDLNAVTCAARLRARGSDKRDRSGAEGMISLQLMPNADGSRVLMQADLALLGPVARYGSLAVVRAAATHIVSQFAEKLRAELSRPKDQTPTTTMPAAAMTQQLGQVAS